MNILFPDERSNLSRESGIRITTLSSSCTGPRFIWPPKAGVSENMKIRPYQDADQLALIALWEEAGLALHLNESRKDIDRKVEVDPDLFLIAKLTARLSLR